MMEIRVVEAKSSQDIEQCFNVRREVFMKEQMISEEDEFDNLDGSSYHYIAFLEGDPAGAARWRKTENGLKLERFCTLNQYRGKGVASEIIRQVLKDCKERFPNQTIYLSAQTDVVGLYEKFGFQTKGDVFVECDIPHVTMELEM